MVQFGQMVERRGREVRSRNFTANAGSASVCVCVCLHRCTCHVKGLSAVIAGIVEYL